MGAKHRRGPPEAVPAAGRRIPYAASPRFRRDWAALPPHVRRSARLALARLQAGTARLKPLIARRRVGWYELACTDGYRILLRRQEAGWLLLGVASHNAVFRRRPSPRSP